MADRFDLEAIEADDALLDLLAAGGESAWEAGEHDPALKLLAGLRLAVEVEDELPVETIDDPESFLARCAALNPVTDPFARKMAARSLAFGVAAVAALSVSGVAAAVNGDPLSPYEKVIEKVVDGLRDETSFPKDQLEGLPVVDKTKIVKVSKNFQAQAAERVAGEKAKDAAEVATEPEAAVMSAAKPPLARAMPQSEQQLLIETPVVPPPVAPEEKPVQPETPVEQPTTEPSTEPTNPPTTEPTNPPTTEPTNPPTTEPTNPPTTEPTNPPTTEPTNPPSTPPTTPAPGGDNNGSTGNPGELPGGGTPSAPVTPPPSVPSPGTGDNGGEQTSPGGDQTGDPQGDDQPGDKPGDDKPGDDKPGDDKPGDDKPSGDQPSPETGNQTGDQGDQKPADPVKDLVDSVLPLRPIQTSTPVKDPERLQQYVGRGFSGKGKHAGTKPALGWARSQYAKGKHSSGHYAEGRHAAIARAHGSVAPVTIRQILGLLNNPMTDR
ncbi:hypothetical protein [Kribbella sp. CA-293567]|uniref:hypothetical protein n=1 Tax=Kribbella sp. CA-293567 TaxID=3002436 RepID=UPI0022DDFF6A|nr:hypothetical protein [Kribbella sp. CA-293567]WBQ06465.1 hypothetical protein OX958_06650 [Kribbella sp. CA-293567]